MTCSMYSVFFNKIKTTKSLNHKLTTGLFFILLKKVDAVEIRQQDNFVLLEQNLITNMKLRHKLPTSKVFCKPVYLGSFCLYSINKRAFRNIKTYYYILFINGISIDVVSIL